MDKALEKYLDTVDRHLRPLPISERVNIIMEIKSSILEMQHEGISVEQILIKLGDPKSLATSYLDALLSKGDKLNRKKYLTALAFYSLTGFSGIIVIPVLGLIAPIFIIVGIVIPAAGIFKLLGHLLNFDTSYVVLNLGPLVLGPVAGFFVSIIVGIILCLLGAGAWKLLLSYISSVSRKKRDLSI